jgi:NAD(P) transhydrogenase subunit alpha
MVPGSRAPLLIDDDMVHAMRPGSVIIDLAAETGGNCALTEPGRRIVTPNGIVIEGTLNLPAQVPVHASQLYAQNLTAFLTLLLEAGIAPGEAPGQWTLNLDADEIVRATCITHAGNIVHQPTLQRIQAKGEE